MEFLWQDLVRKLTDTPFWQDFAIFTLTAWIIIAIMLVVKVGAPNIVTYFKTKDGKGAMYGIVAAPIVILIIALVMLLIPSRAHAQEMAPPRPLDLRVPGTFFNRANVFMGLDQTKKISPMCHTGFYDDRTTSNLGFDVNIWDSPSRNVSLDLVYTHHSCAINPDNKSYDALGVRLKWCIWGCY